MAEVDTSSYRLPTGPSFLDQAQKYGELALMPGRLQQQKQQIESGGITIDKQKLDLVNSHFRIMQSELSNLANDPNATPQEVVKKIHSLGDAFDMPDAVKKHAQDEFADIPNVPLGKDGVGNPLLSRKLDFVIKRGMDMNQRINSQYGADVNIESGQTDTAGKVGLRGGPLPIQAPRQKQAPVGQPVFDANNQQRYLGPQAPQLPEGAVAVPGGFPGQYQMGGRPGLPVAPPMVNAPPGGPTPALPVEPRGNTGVTPDTVSPSQVVQNRSPIGAAAGPTPLFEEGKKLFSKHQEEASSILAASQPAVDALQLMKTPGVLSGPGTEAFTKLVAGLKNIGFINTANENDPTAIQQEIIKKLHQYVSSNPIAQRSDAAQTLREASSPSPNVQILPALMRLTKDAIAYDRVKAAMPTAFTKTENGKDVRNSNYADYGEHIARFPQSVDKRAFILNFEDDDGKKLVDEMTEKEGSKKPKEQAEAAKFFKSLRIAKKQGYYD